MKEKNKHCLFSPCLVLPQSVNYRVNTYLQNIYDNGYTFESSDLRTATAGSKRTFANNHLGSKQISVLVLPSNHNKISFFITKGTTHHCRDRLRVIQNGNKPLKIIFIRRFDVFHIQNGK